MWRRDQQAGRARRPHPAQKDRAAPVQATMPPRQGDAAAGGGSTAGEMVKVDALNRDAAPHRGRLE